MKTIIQHPTKTLWRLMVAMCVMACASACNDSADNDNRSFLKSFKNSGCNSEVYITDNPQRIVCTASDNGYFFVEHTDALYSCSSIITTKATLDEKEKLIMIEEMWDDQLGADCMCHYDLKTEIGPMADGQYTLTIMAHGTELLSQKIFFKKDMNVDIDVCE